MPFFGNKANRPPAENRLDLLAIYVPEMKGRVKRQSIGPSNFVAMPETPEAKAERERLRGVKQEPPIEDSAAYPEPVDTVSEPIRQGEADETVHGNSNWQPGLALRALAQRLRREAEEATLEPSEETVEPAVANPFINRVVLRGLALAAQTRKVTSSLVEHVAHIPTVGIANPVTSTAQRAYENRKIWGRNKDQDGVQPLTVETVEGSDKMANVVVGLGMLATSVFNLGLDKGAGYVKEGTGWLYEKSNLRGEDNKEKRHKLYRLGAVAVLLTGVTVGTAYFSHKSGTSAGHQPSQEAINPTPAQHTKFSEFNFDLPPPLQVAKDHAVHHVHAVAKHAGHHMEHLKYYGDTIWYHAKANVMAKFPHASQEKIGELTNKYSQLIVRVNHIKDTWHMALGQHFKMPRLR